MQTLDVISVNIWQIIISLLNLAILFFVIKKFLYKPVMKLIASRKKSIDDRYDEAQNALSQALKEKEEYEKKLENADEEAQSIIKKAAGAADERSAQIIASAETEASFIAERAKNEAELEKRKARQEIKGEIVSVSTLLAEKLLEREITSDDHKKLIEDFIEEMGESDGED